MSVNNDDLRNTVKGVTPGNLGGLAEMLTAVLRRARRLDAAVALTIAVALTLVIAVPEQAWDSAGFVLRAMGSILPFILLSVLVAAGAKASGLDKQVAAVFSGNPVRTIVIAALFGAASPFCSCGVIPVIAGLLGAGVPLAPVMAFWIASPLMSPEKFLVMLGAFSPDFTIAITLSAVAMGLAAGFATHAIVGSGWLANPLRREGPVSGCGARTLDAGPDVLLAFWRESDRRRVFRDTTVETGLFLFKWLLLAFLIESLMIRYVPADQIGHWLGNDSWWAIPASVLVGIPAYLNGYAAIPLISGLQALGMSPGAATGFMLAGGVTSFPAAMAVYALVRRGVFVWYLVFGLVGSLALAYAVQVALSG